jgi:hypothetical protein
LFISLIIGWALLLSAARLAVSFWAPAVGLAGSSAAAFLI